MLTVGSAVFYLLIIYACFRKKALRPIIDLIKLNMYYRDIINCN